MTFVNEYASAEDKARFDWNQMPSHPLLRELGILPPSFWTVDHERDTFLICTHHGREEDSDKHVFLLWWNGKPLSLGMRIQFVGPNALIWHLTGYPRELANQFDEFIQILHGAIRVYGSSGSPDRSTALLDVQLKFSRPADDRPTFRSLTSLAALRPPLKSDGIAKQPHGKAAIVLGALAIALWLALPVWSNLVLTALLLACAVGLLGEAHRILRLGVYKPTWSQFAVTSRANDPVLFLATVSTMALLGAICLALSVSFLLKQ